MPGISSLIKPKPKWRPKGSGRTPFSSDRFNSNSGSNNISSPHPYASPEILDIHDNKASFGSVTESPPAAAGAAAVEARPKAPSPNIKLDLDLTSDPFDTDWFQTQFTASNTSLPSQKKKELRAGDGTKVVVGGENRSLGFSERWEPRGVPSEVPSEDEYDIDLSTSEGDVLDQLRAMDASTFLNLPPESNQAMDAYDLPPARKNPPTPIRIPSLSMHGPQVQIVRSAEHNSSRPLSEISSTDISAISGQTLARALMGNSFVLSSDTRSSRYKSGFGGLVRSDSATLPRGDHPFLNSPYWGDRTMSGTSDTYDIDFNAPPIPPNADKVYVPPQTPRHSGVEMKKKNNIRRHSSAGSLPSPILKESNDSKSRPSSVVDFGKELEKDNVLAPRRISRISEHSSSNHETPAANPEIPLPSPPAVADAAASTTRPTPREEAPLPPLPAESPLRSPISPNPKSPVPSTEATVSSSAHELDNVLDYYSFPDIPTEPAAERAFAPSFSPIIEESSSQLSSPGSRRLSQRPTPTGSRTMSPLTGTTSGRIDLSSVRRPSDGTYISKTSSVTLLPIGERRRSFQMPPPGSSANAQYQQTQSADGTNNRASTAGGQQQRISTVPPLPPLFNRVIGGRMRSGSAPSPIKVDRDSRDLNAYRITVSPLHTPSTGDSDNVGIQQTFPETPSAFSPFFSPGSNSPGMMPMLPGGQEPMPMPQTPMSATLPTHGSVPPSIERQMLTRAATMVRSRQSRQGSMSRFGAGTRSLPKSQAASASSKQEKGNKEQKDSNQVGWSSSNRTQALPDGSVSSPSQYSETSEGAYGGMSAGFSPFEAVIPDRPQDQPSRASSVESSPRLGYLSKDDGSQSTVLSSSVPPLPQSQPDPPSKSPVEFRDPFNPHTGSSPRSGGRRSPATSPRSHPIQTPPPPVVITPPAGDSTAASPYLGHSLRRISEMSHNLESPPPYYAIHQDQPPPAHSFTPNSGHSHMDLHYGGGASGEPSPPAHHDSSSEYLPLSRKTSSGNRDRRHRARPAIPTGPRRPSSTSHYSGGTGAGRPRNASISSMTSISQPTTYTTTATTNANPSSTPIINPASLTTYPPTPGSRNEPSPTPSAGTTTIAATASSDTSPKSPKFHTPSVRYRGLTMDQAKWTFTSAQLQTVVSRAIRQSAEASSIRLLRLETLDNDIPQEMKRLDTQKAEIKKKYRSLTSTSESLFLKLNNQITSQSSNAQRTAEELRDVTRQLNKLTEELHSVDQQQSQIQNLVQIHSASALSMALRKLNASFLKQLAETQELQKQVANLEDEIWTINELKSMRASSDFAVAQGHHQPHHQPPVSFPSESVPGWSPELERKKSTHSFVRKSSVKYQRPIRISVNSRVSQRSSLSSTGARSSVAGGALSGTNSTFGIPPVPPLPRRYPSDIITDPPTRGTTIFSVDGGTPNTETRAWMRTQDELYQLIGVSLRGDRRLRRSHSVIGLPGNLETQPHPSTANANPHQQVNARYSTAGSLDSHLNSNRASRATPRPVSYPSSLLDAYKDLDADRNAMLATLEMLARDD